jgi:transcriptional regulator with XRE-family HTH domain
VRIRDESATDEALGARLRQIREALGLSLKTVETASGGIVPASMLGSYERGEHTISAQRLYCLSRLYGVSIEHLLIPDSDHLPPLEAESPKARAVRFEMGKLQHARGREAQTVLRLVRVIEERRRKHSTESVELRHEDLVTAAATLGRSVDSFLAVLRRNGVLRRPPGRPPGT